MNKTKKTQIKKRNKMKPQENEQLRNQIEECTTILQSNPDDPNTLNKRGVDRFYLKDYDGALKDYQAAIHADPNFARGYFNIGRLYQDLGDYKMALDHYEKTIELNPMHAEAYCNMGIVYTENDKSDLAIKYYNKAIAINPIMSIAYNNRGMVYKKLKVYSKALKDLNAAIKLQETL